MSQVLERFLRYVKVNTQSAHHVSSVPSTACQFDLADMLARELTQMGASEVRLDSEHCYIYASIPSNVEWDAPVLGLIAHMDTSPEVSDEGVNPRVIEHYDGGKIILSKDGSLTLSPTDFPSLICHKGQTLVVTDGTTLLGGDDKAGVAEIMTVCDLLLCHPEIRHGKVCVAFTPDEEVGRGADYFDIKGFGADFAYTLDGGAAGELEYENFNAAEAKIFLHGISVHPGDARGKMINALLLANEFQQLLPSNETPSATQGYEGFYHLCTLHGGVDSAEMEYIIRDHDKAKFKKRKELITRAADFLNEKYGKQLVNVELTDSYFNMKEIIEAHEGLIDSALRAISDAGVAPIVQPIRGGTDGAMLSYLGLPCPNLGIGIYNAHGRYEYACVEEMEQTVSILYHLIENAGRPDDGDQNFHKR